MRAARASVAVTLAAAVLACASCERLGIGGASGGGGGGDGGAAIDHAKYAAYLTRYPFGGHTTEAWAARLIELKSGPKADAKLYALTVERAKANGLVVEEQGDLVTVKPGPELAALIIERMELK